MEYKKPWYKKPAWWGVIVAFLAVIISIVVWQCPPHEKSFSMSVNPLTGYTYQGGVLQTLVTVEGIGGYNKDVILSTDELPHGIVVTFMPKGGPTPPYSSTMTITTQSGVAVGTYTITIKGLGGDGQESNIKYVLTVNPPSTTTTSPTQTTTPPTETTATTTTPPTVTTPATTTPPTETAPTTTPQFAVAITAPKEGDTVPWEFKVSGYVEGLPADWSIWICVYPPNYRYYPQAELHFSPQVVGESKREWDVAARLGQSITINLGDTFKIYTVLANKSATDFLLNYVEEASASGEWPGMAKLPNGTNIYPPVTVIKVNEVNISDVFYPSYWIGDYDYVQLDPNCDENPYSSPTCIKITYSASQSQELGWSGIYWTYPENNWGNNPAAQDLTGVTKLTFWARGQNGGEKAEFKIGGIEGAYSDTIKPAISTGIRVLSSSWRKYSIDLTGKNLTHMIGGFCWVTSASDNPDGCTIYLDDIKYE